MFLEKEHDLINDLADSILSVNILSNQVHIEYVSTLKGRTKFI